jgi:DNA-binding NarL/FixJ family response regulator
MTVSLRIAIIGPPSDRARLRARLNGSMQVAAEFATLAAARAADLDIDAMLVAPGRGDPDDLRDREPAAAFAAGDDDLEAAEPLTPREIEVLELLAEGLPNKSIAVRLGISDQTVKFHVASISGKLGAANRTDAVRRAVRRGLIAL